MQNGLGGSTPPLNCEEKKLYVSEHDKKNIKVKNSKEREIINIRREMGSINKNNNILGH